MLRQFVLALLTSVAMVHAWQLDFTKSQPSMHWWSSQRNLNRCRLSYDTLPNGTQVLRGDWDASITDYFHILHSFKPKFPACPRLKATVRLTSTMPLPLKTCRLRLQDNNIETFYWDKKVDFMTPGTQTLEWVVDLENPKPTSRTMHGKDNNGKIDFPLNTCGITLTFPQNGLAGHIFVESLTLEPLAALPKPQTVKEYPLTSMAKPFVDPLTMPQRIPYPTALTCAFETATNPGTGKQALKLIPKDTKSLGVTFTTGGSPRGVLGQKLGRQHGGELVVLLTTEKPMPEITKLQFHFIEAVGGSYMHSVPVTLDRAGQHRIRVPLPALVRTKKPWGTRDWQETPIFALAGVRLHANANISAPVFLDAVEAQWHRSPLEALLLQLETGTVAKVITPEQAAQGVLATLTNLDNITLQCQLEAKLTDSDDHVQEWRLKQPLTLKPGEKIELCRVPVPKRFGTYYLDVTVSADGHEPQTYRRSFAHFQPTGPTHDGTYAKGFYFGSVAHLDPYFMSRETVKEAADAMAQIGLRILRTDVRWNESPAYLSHLDYVVDTFMAHGMNFDFILPGIRKPKGVPEYQVEKCLSGYQKLFERYRGRIQFWEMLNEPDIPWGPVAHAPKVDAYIDLAKKTNEVLRKTDPQAKFMSAGWCTLEQGARNMGRFHAPAMDALKNVFDIHSFHGHGPFEHYARHTISEGLLDIRRKYNVTIPWYANETALTSRGGVTERLQADALYKKLLFSWSRGAIGFTWYNLRSKGELPEDGEHNYGMMTWDFYPKAVYAAYNALTQTYRQKDFDHDYQLPAGQWALRFKGKDEWAIALWNDEKTNMPRIFRTDATSAESRDIFGNATPLAIRNGIVQTMSGHHPTTLILKNATVATLLPPLVQLLPPQHLIPGQAQDIIVKLANPFPEARAFTLNFSVPPTLALSQQNFQLEIPGNSSQTISCQLKLNADAASKLAASEWIHATYQLQELETQRQLLTIPIPYLFESRLDGQPHFKLDNHNSVVELFVGDPSKEDSIWKGPHDLSAHVWFALDDQALHIKVVATDDQHCQKNAAQDRTWDGDNIQLFLMDKNMSRPVELDFARLENGDNYTYLRKMPPNYQGKPELLKLTTSREQNQTTYHITVPFAAIGSTADSFKQGFRCNLMVNDADNNIREGWVHLAPGIGYGNVTAKMLPFFLKK